MVGKKSLISGKIVYLLFHNKQRFVDEMDDFYNFLWSYAWLFVSLQRLSNDSCLI